MKSIIVFIGILLFAINCALSATLSNKDSKNEQQQEQQKHIPIVTLENVVEHDGKFHYSYETGHGIKAAQDGDLKVVDPEHAGESIQGQFSYIGDDGQTYSVRYTADENGYQAQGEHIPTPPPVPQAIARALAYLATAPPPKEEQSQKNKNKNN